VGRRTFFEPAGSPQDASRFEDVFTTDLLAMTSVVDAAAVPAAAAAVQAQHHNRRGFFTRCALHHEPKGVGGSAPLSES
jgi:cytochrome c553